MTFDPHIPIEAPVKRPGRPRKPEASTPIPTIAGQSAAELKRSFGDGLPAEDSFHDWARNMPDDAFVRWAQSVQEFYAQKSLAHNVPEHSAQESWDRASAVIASLRGGQKRFSNRIAMPELESSEAFQKLNETDQKTCRWIVSNQESLTLRARAAAKAPAGAEL